MRRCLLLMVLGGLVGCAENGSNWIPYGDSEAGFEARFPAPPIMSTQPVQVAGKDQKIHLVEAKKDGWTYSVGYFDTPPMSAFIPSKAVDGLAAGLKGTVVGTKESSIAGTDQLLPALQFDLKVGEEPVEGKIFQPEENAKHPMRVYQIVLFHPKGAPSRNASVFYHYFKVMTR